MVNVRSISQEYLSFSKSTTIVSRSRSSLCLSFSFCLSCCRSSIHKSFLNFLRKLIEIFSQIRTRSIGIPKRHHRKYELSILCQENHSPPCLRCKPVACRESFRSCKHTFPYLRDLGAACIECTQVRTYVRFHVYTMADLTIMAITT